MIRKAAVAIALLLLTVSYRLSALGLGEIDMQSALNQPMKADISLTSAADVDIEAIKVMLGSREAHERLGLSRAKILSNFKFDIVKDGRGSPVINISSTESVREPYLEFLLELVWENGRIVREYTILVDPPVTMPAKPVAPIAPVVQAPAVVPPPVEPVARPAPAPRPPATTFSPSPVEQRVADTYGPVRREEALWSISDRLRPDSDISIQQMMIALLRANPQAFPDNNINNMKVGSTLTIPDRDAILALTANQARAEAGRQYNEWLEKRDVASAAAKDIAVVEESVADTPVKAAVVVAESDAQLKLTPPQGDPVAGAAISSGAGESAGETARDDNIRQQLALALEEVEASKAHSSELQSRVLELEATIERMDRLLKLKSDPLASLQNNVGNQAEEPQPGAEIVAEVEGVEIGETEMAVGEAEELAAVTAEDEIVVATDEGDVAEALDIAEEADAITADMAVVEDEIAPEAESPVIDGIVKKLMDNPVLAGLGVLVAMLLGGFLWGSTRKHGDQDMFDDESESDERFTDVDENASASVERVTSISDPGTYDDGVEDTMEVSSSDAANDPITEADVYLAYGRVHQAEDVLQEALREDPDNLAIRAKLLDVFHAAGNVAGFNNAAGEYRELAPEANEEWKRIAIMGYELAPGNELYSAVKQASSEADNSVDFDMDLSGMDDMSSEAAITDAADDLALSMDEETAEVNKMPETLEFTLDDTPEDELNGEGLLASTDEVATKLDLARAYLDMEDPEGARSILQEVLEEGSTEQKSEAESLISKIV